jgi:DUF971 family protein
VPTVFLTELHRLPEARRVKLVFDDGVAGEVPYDTLRGYCPCAGCQGHWAEAIRFHAPARPVEPVNIEPVGNYGVSIHWSDGHATGIYRFDFLRQIALEAGADDQPPIRLEDPA